MGGEYKRSRIRAVRTFVPGTTKRKRRSAGSSRARRLGTHVSFQLRRKRGAVFCEFSGRMDSLSLAKGWWRRIADAVAHPLPKVLVFDLRKVTFIDSAAYGRIYDTADSLGRKVPRVSIMAGQALRRLLALRGEDEPPDLTDAHVSFEGDHQGENTSGEAVCSEPIVTFETDPQPGAPGAAGIPEVHFGTDPEAEDEDVFVIDLDFEKKCLSREERASEEQLHQPLEFKKTTHVSHGLDYHSSGAAASQKQCSASPELSQAEEVDEGGQADRDREDEPVILAVSSQFEDLNESLGVPDAHPITGGGFFEFSFDGAQAETKGGLPGGGEPEPGRDGGELEDGEKPASSALEEMPRRTGSPSDGIEGDRKDRMLDALLSMESLRRENGALQEALAKMLSENRRYSKTVSKLQARLAESAESRGDLPLNAFAELSRGEAVWRKLHSGIGDIEASFQKEMRINPELLFPLLKELAVLSRQGALAVYGPVFPPEHGVSPAATVLGMAAAVSVSLGLNRDATIRFLFVSLMAHLYRISMRGAMSERAFADQMAKKLREIGCRESGLESRVLEYIAVSHPVRLFASMLFEMKRNVNKALDMFVNARDSVDPAAYRAFMNTFGVWPRGCTVRLTDGSIGSVFAPFEHDIVVIRSWRRHGGALYKTPLTPLAAGRNRDLDVVGPVMLAEKREQCDCLEENV